MNAVTEYIIALTNLAEAEGRDFRSAVLYGTLTILVLVLMACLAGLGLFLLIRGIFIYLELVMGEASAAVTTGVLALIVAGGTSWIAIRHLPPRR